MLATKRRSRERVCRRDLSESPLIVFYELTRACDLVCQHCRACAQALPDPAELRPAESLCLIEQLRSFESPPMLVLTGGDPFKRADLFDLVARSVELGMEVSITPSATPLVTPDSIRRLRDAGLACMAISIDGADAATHDVMRGVPGSFDRSLGILSVARELGLPTQVNTTLHPGNVSQMEAMAELWESHGIMRWSVFFLVPVGRAALMPRLNAAECEVAFARLWRETLRRPYVIKTTEAPHFRRFAIQSQLASAREGTRDARPTGYVPLAVNDGKGVMFVSHSGTISPSGFLPIDCGVFPRESVVQVYQESPVFQALRDADRLEGKCRECEFRNICGGSRARAFAVTGNLLAEEPDCAYVPPGLPSSIA